MVDFVPAMDNTSPAEMSTIPEPIKKFLSNIRFPLNRTSLQNMKGLYDSEIITNFINDTVDKITYDIIIKASNGSPLIVGVNNNALPKMHEIHNAMGYIFRGSPHQVQTDCDKYFKIIIDRLRERFGDVFITIYPPGNIQNRTSIYFDWS